MQVLTFRESTPITGPVTKFGGQPVWIDAPAWPLSRSTGRPMRFIGQAALPEAFVAGGRRMAYFFMTNDADDYVDGTWEAEGGENAVILQPGPFEPIVDVAPVDTGPTLQKAVDDPASPRRTFADVELAVDLVEMDPASDEANLNLSQWLGEPRWLQSEEVPAGGPWRFLMQIDSNSDSYVVNFGDAGVAYVFVAEDGSAARFLWQCC